MNNIITNLYLCATSDKIAPFPVYLSRHILCSPTLWKHLITVFKGIRTENIQISNEYLLKRDGLPYLGLLCDAKCPFAHHVALVTRFLTSLSFSTWLFRWRKVCLSWEVSARRILILICVTSPPQLPSARGTRERRERHRWWLMLIWSWGWRRHLDEQLEWDYHWSGSRQCHPICSSPPYLLLTVVLDCAWEPHLQPEDCMRSGISRQAAHRQVPFKSQPTFCRSKPRRRES